MHATRPNQFLAFVCLLTHLFSTQDPIGQVLSLSDLMLTEQPMYRSRIAFSLVVEVSKLSLEWYLHPIVIFEEGICFVNEIELE